jgi:hypothetical protein
MNENGKFSLTTFIKLVLILTIFMIIGTFMSTSIYLDFNFKEIQQGLILNAIICFIIFFTIFIFTYIFYERTKPDLTFEIPDQVECRQGEKDELIKLISARYDLITKKLGEQYKTIIQASLAINSMFFVIFSLTIQYNVQLLLLLVLFLGLASYPMILYAILKYLYEMIYVDITERQLNNLIGKNVLKQYNFKGEYSWYNVLKKYQYSIVIITALFISFIFFYSLTFGMKALFESQIIECIPITNIWGYFFMLIITGITYVLCIYLLKLFQIYRHQQKNVDEQFKKLSANKSNKSKQQILTKFT